MKVKESLDISDLYELVFKFDEHVDTSFKETATELDTIRTPGAKGNIPSGYIVSSLWVLKQFAWLIPSG